jgi:NitT/TauT family transport system permease protein
MSLQTAIKSSEAGTDSAVAIVVAQTSPVERILRIVMPFAMLALAVGLPGSSTSPSTRCRATSCRHRCDVVTALFTDWPTLYPSLLVTVRVTLLALALALIGGVGLAIILVQSKWIELAIFPFAVILQVTPMIAIAPLLIIYIKDPQTVLLTCAFIVAFFPILSNMVAGSEERRPQPAQPVRALWRKRWQTLIYPQAPGRPCPISWRASGSAAGWR